MGFHVPLPLDFSNTFCPNTSPESFVRVLLQHVAHYCMAPLVIPIVSEDLYVFEP